MITTAAVGLGYLLDGLIGDPPQLPHPVRGIGWLIAQGERRWNHGSPVRRLVLGTVLSLLVVSTSVGIAWALVAGATRIHPGLGLAATALGAGVLLARRSLALEAGERVYYPLEKGDLPAARQAVAMVVGRDTDTLDESGISRAAVETLAENASDGVIAPLLFGLLGGLPAMAAYKAINTLDSMIGYNNDRYRYFGRFAARLDDVANWIPARVAFLGVVTAAFLQGGGATASRAWHGAKSDAAKHASPNAGWPEAAMAGALGIRLGGTNCYGGVERPGPVFYSQGRAATSRDILTAVNLMHLSCHLTFAAGACVRIIVSL